MIQPKPRKFRKWNRHCLRTTYENKCNKISFGIFGLQALERNFLNPKQIEAIRRTITSFLKKKGKIWIRAFPDYPITAKPKEVRMGRGKGNVAQWVSVVKPGKILFEALSKDHKLLQNALIFAKRKLPFSSQVICRVPLL